MYLSIGSVIIDDIILPDGQSRMAVLGGGAPHAMMGMRAWTNQVRLVAGVGPDFPPSLERQLAEAFLLDGLIYRPHLPTPRAWQLFEFDGHRSEVFRTTYQDFLDINPLPDEIPAELLQAKGVHLHAEAPDPLREWITRLRATSNPFLLWEPWDMLCLPENYAVIREIFQSVDCFSPNLEESQALTGLRDPQAVVRRFLDDGAGLVALRMGGQGSLVARCDGPCFQVVPVKPEKLVDVTGAGNAYCGGFIVGMGETGDITQAARYAAVSASLALEQFGAMVPLDGLHQRAIGRLENCLITEVDCV